MKTLSEKIDLIYREEKRNYDTTDVLICSTSPQLSGVQIESAMTEVARSRRSIDYTTTVLAKAQLMAAIQNRRGNFGLYLP